MQNKLIRIEEIEQKIKKLERKKMEQEIQEKNLLTKLKEEFGIDDVKQAEEKIQDLDFELTEMQKKLEVKYNDFNNKYGEELNRF